MASRRLFTRAPTDPSAVTAVLFELLGVRVAGIGSVRYHIRSYVAPRDSRLAGRHNHAVSRPPAFPPDVAKALQSREGEVSFRYTHPAPLAGPPDFDTVLMITPYEEVLASLTLDTKLNLRFVRTGSRAEGARVALVNVNQLIDKERHWDVTLAWNANGLRVTVRPQHADGPVLTGSD
jgi:hypothetical protein